MLQTHGGLSPPRLPFCAVITAGEVLTIIIRKELIREKNDASDLPMSLIGRGPNLSIRIPRGSVAALRKKEPMVKPRFSISSCSTQLCHLLPGTIVLFLPVVSFAGKQKKKKIIHSYNLREKQSSTSTYWVVH